MATLTLESRVRRLIAAAEELEITAGIQAEQGRQRHPDDESGPVVAEIAAWNHYGTRRIPPRPWLSQAAAEYGRGWLRAYSDGLRQYAATGSEAALETRARQVAVVMVSDCQAALTELREPKNAASTIRRKGSDNPLIDTGHLRASHRAALIWRGTREVVG